MTAPVPLVVERLAEVLAVHRYMPCAEHTPTVNVWWAQCEGCDWRGPRRSHRHADESDHRAHVARALLPVVEQAVAEGRAAALREAAKEAEERGDIGKDGGIEAWEWLRIRAGRIAVPVAADRDECPGDHAGPCFEGRPELCRDILRDDREGGAL